MKTGILLDPRDSVITLTQAVDAGETIGYLRGAEEHRLVARSATPQFHKLAVSDIPEGDKVYKYGAFIGYAQSDIAAGDYVHTHNLYSTRRKERGRA